MDNTTFELLDPDVKIAARAVSREWPTVVDTDDVEQEIWMVLLGAGEESVQLVVQMDLPQRIRTLSTYGHRVAAKERDDYDLFAGNFTYGVDEVGRLLEDDAMVKMYADNPGDMTTTERLDIHLAMVRLQEKNPRYAFLLTEKFLNGVRFEHSDPDRRACDRAVDALTLEMNRSRRTREAAFEGPGSR